MKYPFERQKDLKDCGVCCLLMLTRYYGGGISKEYLRDITNTTKDGVTAFNLIEGAKKIGFDAYGVKGDIEELDNKNCPCIAHVIYKKSYQHFIVIYKIDKKKKRLLIADPNTKLSYMSFEEFKKISTNHYILIKPRRKLMYVDKNTKLHTFLADYIKNNTKSILSLFIISIVITFIQVFLSFQFKILLEYVINYNTINNLVFLMLIFLSLILIKEISNFRRNRLVNNINHDLDKSLFINVYNHLLSLPYLYYKNRTTGEIVARMNDLVNIRNAISKFIVTCLIDLVLMVGSFIILSFISLKLTIISIIIFVLILLVLVLFNEPLDKNITKSKELAANTDSYLVETISGIETIRNQNIVSYIKQRFLLKYSKYNQNSLHHNNIFIALDFIKSLIISIGDLLIIVVGSYLVVSGNIDIASLITFITLNNYLFNPIDNLTDLLLSLKEAKISFKRINELYEIKEETISKHKSHLLDGNITCNHLTYSYNNLTPFLKDINITIKAGDRVLIYGNSGSGKSTFAKILTGNLKVINNKLFIDDRDINRYDSTDLRENMCYISNNEAIFTDSIYNNLLLDKEEPNTFDEVMKTCLVDEFVSKNDLAYNQLLEENGFNISSGQKQRICLARSLLKNSKIYILDEALNQVDIARERQILTNIFNKNKDKTFIYITHRFNNSDLFDKKYRIENGVSYEETI